MKKGYGLVFKDITTSKEFSIEAKAIYAYFSAYAGCDGDAFPSVARICEELCIGEDRFRNHLKQLTKAGVVVVEVIKQKGTFSRNNYKINHKISITTSSETQDLYPDGKGTPYPCDGGDLYPCGAGTLYPYDGGTLYPCDEGTTNNRFTINNIINNNNNIETAVVASSSFVNNSLENQKDKEYKNKIENTINDKINLKTVNELLNKFGEDKINLYLNNWSRFKNKVKKNASGLFINALKEEYTIPKDEAKIINNNYIPNMHNFEQREYDSNFFEQFYFKPKEE